MTNMNRDLNEYELAHNAEDLLAAARCGTVEQVRRLIPLCDPKHNESEALRTAAYRGHLDCVALLLPHSDATADECGAFILAAGAGHMKCAQLLLPYSDPSSSNNEALRVAVEYGHSEVVKMLVPLLDILDDEDHQHAFCRAAEGGHTECVRLLLPYLDPKNNDSQALYMAACCDRDDCVDLLFDVSDPHIVLQRIDNWFQDPKQKLDAGVYLKQKIAATQQKQDMLSAVSDNAQQQINRKM